MLIRACSILLLALAVPAAAATRLNVAIGADVNVVEVHKTVLGPGFAQANRTSSSTSSAPAPASRPAAPSTPSSRRRPTPAASRGTSTWPSSAWPSPRRW